MYLHTHTHTHTHTHAHTHTHTGKHESCMYQVEERIISIVYQFSDDAELIFGSGNVTITLVCGLTLVR